jgi:hypothetical protein
MEVIVKNIYYQLDKINKTAKVIGYIGEPIEVIFPEFIRYRFRKYKVTSIGGKAFYRCSSLTSITIPDSVTEIGNDAFYNCWRLTPINIPDSVTSIGEYTFCKCSSLTSITIPDSVTSIGEGAFGVCSSLTSITIPDSVTEIGNSTFYYCKKLTSVTMGNSVTSIGDWAFDGCSSLTSITIPDSVTYIGERAFWNCSSLNSIVIPNNITSIGSEAFYKVGISLPKRYTEDGKLIAYKGFRTNMTCRDFQYVEGESYEIVRKIKLCECGFHACTNPLDVFNYYSRQIGKDIYIHEVYLSGEIDDNNEDDSKVCSSNIEIGKRLTIKDINNIINS